jgi:hypothetical protein
LRFFYLQSYAKKGEKAQYFHSEVVQRWVAPDGRYATVAKLRPMSYFADTWNFSSTLEIRPERPLHNILPTGVYPRQRLIPELKRSGYAGKFYRLTPFDLFHALLTDSRAETLLKTGQTGLLKFFVNNGFRHIDCFWDSIKICIRNAYRVDDASLWRDYIDLLQFFGKDLHNAKYVCPADLKADSLILSARIEGKPVETVELSLSRLKVLQSRGVFNCNTEYHERIIKLVEKNISVIRKHKRKSNAA